MRTHVKTPQGALTVRLDFTAFIAKVGAAAITYTLRADPGIDVDVDTPTLGVFDLEVSGGRLGQAYRFGIEAHTGKHREVQAHRVRIREPRDWPSCPVVGDIDPAGEIPDGALLLDGFALLLDDGYLVLVGDDELPDGTLFLDDGALLLDDGVLVLV